MPRTRLINPEFFLHEGLGRCSPHARLLFIALWTQADREGRLRWLPLRIHGETFPHEPKLSIDALGQELREAGVLVLYSIGSKRLAWLPKFTTWQNPHRNETVSKLPPPPDGTLLATPSKGRPKEDQRKTKGRPDTSTNTSPNTCPNPDTSSPSPRAGGGKLVGDPLRLAGELRQAIATHSPKYAKKVKVGQLERWAVFLERLIRLDEAEPEEISRIIRWAHLHPDGSFWRSNVMCGASLRRQFPKLLLQSELKKKRTEVDVDAEAIAAAIDLGASL